MNKLAIVLLCALPCCAVAEQSPAPPDAPQIPVVPQQVETQNDELDVLDEPRDYLSKKFVGMVTGIDRFFGDERDFQENNKSVLQLDLTRVSGYGGDKNVLLSGRAKVELPSTEKRLHLLIESDPDKNVSGTPPPVKTTAIKDVNAPTSYAAALRFEKAREELRHYSTDAGIKFQGLNSNPFARARASYAVPFEQWRMKFAETAFWFNNLGVGASSQLDLEHTLSEAVLFRASSNATWLHDKQNLDLRQDVTSYHTLDERRALLYQLSAIGTNRPQYHASDYVVSALYRYRLHQRWMYLEISPQLHYPQIRKYQVSPMLSLRLEILLDSKKSVAD